jgi:hypothetical protein
MKSMKLFLPLLMLLFVGSNLSAADCAQCGQNSESAIIAQVVASADKDADKEKNQQMTVKVKKIVDSERHAKRLKRKLMKLDGIKEVGSCTKSGTVKISFNKEELGCCSKIAASLEKAGYNYELVSNPSCKEDKKDCPGKGEAKADGGCDKHKS